AELVSTAQLWVTVTDAVVPLTKLRLLTTVLAGTFTAARYRVPEATAMVTDWPASGRPMVWPTLVAGPVPAVPPLGKVWRAWANWFINSSSVPVAVMMFFHSSAREPGTGRVALVMPGTASPRSVRPSWSSR